MESSDTGGRFPIGRFYVGRSGREAPFGLRGAAVAIGNFDGVHRGHQQLIAAAQTLAARELGGRPVAILTFEPHPRSFFAPERPMFRLTPEAEKLIVLRRLGLDGVFVCRFDAALAATSAADFVDRLIVEEMQASAVVVGYDFHFGKGREGTPELLRTLCEPRGVRCAVVPAVEEAGAAVSSSAIRAALCAGEIDRANALLGYRWFVTGQVRHGQKRGRELGYPTANMRLDEGCGLRHGIYAVRMALNGPGEPSEMRDGVASFGRRPTFDNGAPLLETFLFDFSGDLYGREVAVEFVARIRDEERFASVAALVERMDLDARTARAQLAAGDGLPSMLE